jgi:hypothetical protein
MPKEHLDAIDDILQETFPTASAPSLDANNINHPGASPFDSLSDTAHGDPVPQPITHLETDLSVRP